MSRNNALFTTTKVHIKSHNQHKKTEKSTSLTSYARINVRIIHFVTVICNVTACIYTTKQQ